MLINPRLPVLFLVVGSFMGLWNGDKQVSPETVIAQAKAIAHQQMIAENLRRAALEEIAQESYDEPVDQSVVATETVPQPVEETVVVDEPEAADEPKVVAETVAEPTAKVIGTTVASTVSNDIDVPGHVAAGFYRAVNHKGQAKIVQVLPNAENSAASSRDFYTLEAETDRWYLIRLDVPSIAASPDLMFIQ